MHATSSTLEVLIFYNNIYIPIDKCRYLIYEALSDMEKIKSFIKDLGFPVAVALFLLYICHFTIRQNTDAINTLARAVDKLIVSLDRK